MDNYFREPLLNEPDGTYITKAQMQFFLNRPKGTKKFATKTGSFLEYYNVCRVYNLVSDMMEDDDTCAIMYWDGRRGTVSMAFPASGTVASAVDDIQLHTSPNRQKFNDYFDDDNNEMWSSDEGGEW